MDALLETSEQLSCMFNYLSSIGISFQVFFIIVILTQTPKEMTTYKYTMMNCTSWSLLIVIHFGVLVRPVTFLPLPVSLITGPVKTLGSFYGGHLQVLVGLILLINKSTAYMMCLCSHFFALRFPMFVRRLCLRDGFLIFIAVHVLITTFLIFSAYISGLFSAEIPVPTGILKKSIEVYWPERYKTLEPLINQSLIIGVQKASLHCFYTSVYLVISLSENTICLSLMVGAIILLTKSIKIDKSSSNRTYKKRLIRMVIIRTIIPMLTFNLPAFFGVYVVQFDRDETSAFAVQFCLLVILLSPAVCCLITVFGIKPYREGLYRVLRLKSMRDSISEHSSDTTTNSKRFTLRSSTVYSTNGTLFSNTAADENFRANRI